MEWFVYIAITLVALVQIPIAIDLLRFVFPKWKLARLASRAVYFILFTAMGSIFCIGLSYHLFVYLPLLAGEHPLQSVKGFLHVLFAVWVWVNVVGNYYFSVFLHLARIGIIRLHRVVPSCVLCLKMVLSLK